MTCRIYNIVYKPNGILDGILPKEIVADLNKYSADVGFGNMNSKAYQAIKDIIGFEAESCNAGEKGIHLCSLNLTVLLSSFFSLNFSKLKLALISLVTIILL